MTYLMPVLQHMPLNALAAIITSGVLGLFDYQEGFYLFRVTAALSFPASHHDLGVLPKYWQSAILSTAESQSASVMLPGVKNLRPNLSLSPVGSILAPLDCFSMRDVHLKDAVDECASYMSGSLAMDPN